MYKINADTEKNRLYITINGILSLDEAQKAKEAIQKYIPTLQPGFDVINDISKLIRADETGGKVLKEINILLIQSNVNRIIRIIGTSKTALLQFANNTIQADHYKIHYVPSIKEAEAILQEKN